MLIYNCLNKFLVKYLFLLKLILKYLKVLYCNFSSKFLKILAFESEQYEALQNDILISNIENENYFQKDSQNYFYILEIGKIDVCVEKYDQIREVTEQIK